MIKQQKYYVTMTDKFMSGWGMAEGKINKLVFECESFEMAEIVEDNANCRTDMKYVNVVDKKPYYNSKRYYPQYVNERDGYECWFKPNYFRMQKYLRDKEE